MPKKTKKHGKIAKSSESDEEDDLKMFESWFGLERGRSNRADSLNRY